jgi:Fuc2NAc and GlcNAc transferase
MVANASMIEGTVAEAVAAMAVAACLTRIVIAVAVRGSVLAVPNQRSSHTVPTPTMGGIAIALPVLAWCVYRIGQDPLCWAVLGGGGIIALLGVVDDLRDLSARVRLPVQTIAVAVALGALPIAIPLVVPPISIHPTWLVVSLYFLIVLWMVNLYNFMDGIDGIATTQCIVYCAGVLLIGHTAAFTSELLWVLLGSAVGFLWFNRYPARIFMGDVGSGLLGLLVGILSLTLDARHQMPLIASLILLAGFWFDATYTLCVRIGTGQKFASAHRSHLYQKCAQRFGHGRTTSMFVAFAVVWLLPLSWLSVAFPRNGLGWLAVAVTPIFVASVRMGAGRAEYGASA